MPGPAATGRRWLLAGVFALANLHLAAVLSLALWAFVPVVLGWTPLVITSGSMTPTITTGDIVVVDPYDGGPLEVGTVVSYREAGRLVTHRIVAETEGGYVTRGDANATTDSTTLTPGAVKGTGRILIPVLGRPYAELEAGRSGPALLWGAITLVTLVVVSARPGVLRSRPGPLPAPVAASAPSPVDPAPAAGPEPASGVWHARKPLGGTVPARTGWAARSLADLPRILGVAACAVLLVVVGTAVAPLAGATDSAGSWQAQLDPPTNVTADPGCSNTTPHVDVGWTANTSADGYHVQRKVNTGTWGDVHTVTDPTLEQWRDNEVSDGNDYHYRLQSYLDTGWTSDYSGEASATVDGSLICL